MGVLYVYSGYKFRYSLPDTEIHVLRLFFPSLDFTCSLNGVFFFSWAELLNCDGIHFMFIAFGVLLKKSLPIPRS